MKRVILAAALLLFGAGVASARDSVSFSINYTIDPYATTRVRDCAPAVTPAYYPAPRTVDWRPATIAARDADDCRTVVRNIYRNGILVERRVRTICADEFPGEERYRAYDRRGGWRHRGLARHGDDD